MAGNEARNIQIMQDLIKFYELYKKTKNPQTRQDLLECLVRVQSRLKNTNDRSAVEEESLQKIEAIYKEVKEDKDLASTSKKNH
jgi:hypothetical protein